MAKGDPLRLPDAGHRQRAGLWPQGELGHPERKWSECLPSFHISRAQSEAGPVTPAPHAGACLVGLGTATLVQQ